MTTVPSIVKSKNYFLAGLITILPLWFTFFILWLLFRWISGVTAPILRTFFYIFDLDRVAEGYMVTIVSFFLTLSLIYITGVLVSNFVSRRFLSGIEALIIKIPIIGDVYGSMKVLIRFFTQERAYSSVVLVRFPHAQTYSIGFVTVDSPAEINAKTKKDMINVFVPTVPNITTGFLIFVPKTDIIPLSLDVDKAVKLIMSGGIIPLETPNDVPVPSPENQS